MSTSFDDALDRVADVADAVLFEGYLLYPYRASARKNQLRWQFGVLTPSAWAEAAGESWYSHSECVFEPGGPESMLRVRLRFLRLRQRQVQRCVDGGFVDTERLVVTDALGQEVLHLPWDEGLPEVVDVDLRVADLARAERVVAVELPAGVTVEPVPGADGAVVGRLVRRTWAVRGRIVVGTEPVPGPYGALRLRVRVENTGSDSDGEGVRDTALRTSLIAAHTVLALSDGVFLSMTDPPEWAAPAVRACVNEHVWPVLAGDRAHPDVVLCSPIILEDFPEIAPESPNQLFDGLENDEILTLRTMVLTDEEKREARATDPRVAHLVDAVDSMPPEIFERLHGAIRSMKPASGPTSFEAAGTAFDGVPTFGQVYDRMPDEIPTIHTPGGGDPTDTGGRPWWDPGADASVDPETDSVLVGGHRVARGTRVVLHPNGRADAQDLFLAGRPATVQAVLHDVDGDVHLAVSITDDPAAEFQAAHGRYRYFRPDEVEVTP